MRRPASDDTELWRRAVRDVAPLPGRRPPQKPQSQPPPLVRPSAETSAAPAIDHRPPALPPPLDRHAGVDRATAERLRRGRYPIEATLDLHGMTQERAHRALAGFIGASRAAGRRCVLIVTGHGRMSGGVLKAAVPRWLDEPGLRPHLLMIAPARPPDGGTGALYVLLRRLPY